MSTPPLLVLVLLLPLQAPAAAPPSTPEAIEAFMRSATVVRTRGLSTGITRPLRLTLKDADVTHDAVFQAVDQKQAVFTPAHGTPEVNFVDSWRYNVAAYRLARLVGLEWMMPVTIEYRFQGRNGSLSWWRDSLMDERKRRKDKVRPPDVRAWNHDWYRMRVFSSLVYDSDRNLTNVLVSPQWRVIMLDFTRAFRLHETIKSSEINHCDRQLLARLEALTPELLKTAAGEVLTAHEMAAVMKRRDLLVAHVKELIAGRGEDKVLY
jgi:hypothetical protein